MLISDDILSNFELQGIYFDCHLMSQKLIKIKENMQAAINCTLAHRSGQEILAATNNLMHGSQMVERLVQNGEMKIVGAEYSLKTAEVHFFE